MSPPDKTIEAPDVAPAQTSEPELAHETREPGQQDVLAGLQQSAGNKAVASLFGARGIQRAPNDDDPRRTSGMAHAPTVDPRTQAPPNVDTPMTGAPTAPQPDNLRASIRADTGASSIPPPVRHARVDPGGGGDIRASYQANTGAESIPPPVVHPKQGAGPVGPGRRRAGPEWAGARRWPRRRTAAGHPGPNPGPAAHQRILRTGRRRSRRRRSGPRRIRAAATRASMSGRSTDRSRSGLARPVGSPRRSGSTRDRERSMSTRTSRMPTRPIQRRSSGARTPRITRRRGGSRAALRRTARKRRGSGGSAATSMFIPTTTGRPRRCPTTAAPRPDPATSRRGRRRRHRPEVRAGVAAASREPRRRAPPPTSFVRPSRLRRRTRVSRAGRRRRSR